VIANDRRDPDEIDTGLEARNGRLLRWVGLLRPEVAAGADRKSQRRQECDEPAPLHRAGRSCEGVAKYSSVDMIGLMNWDRIKRG
jgi:hypothetical protein